MNNVPPTWNCMTEASRKAECEKLMEVNACRACGREKHGEMLQIVCSTCKPTQVSLNEACLHRSV